MSSFVNSAAAVVIGLLIGAAAFYGLSSIDTDNLTDDYPTYSAGRSEQLAGPARPPLRVEESGQGSEMDDRSQDDVAEVPSVETTPNRMTVASTSEHTVDDAPPTAEPYRFTPPPVLPGDVDYRADRPPDLREIPVPHYQPVQYCLSAVFGLGHLDPPRLDALIARCLATLPF